MFFQLAALAILVAFYGCYFGKMLRQKKQGIHEPILNTRKMAMIGMFSAVAMILMLFEYAL